MDENNIYETMKNIGAEHGLTNHQLGKFLTANGFREDGKPSAKAFEHGWVKQRFAPDGMNYMWAWNVGKTRALLEWKCGKR